MENIYVSNLRLEQCSPQKDKVKLIMPRTSIHYIIDGCGYFNDIKLSAGNFFCATKNTDVCYYPDFNTPWTYIYMDLYGENLNHTLNRYGFVQPNCTGDYDYADEIIKIEQLYQVHDKKAGYNKDFLCAVANMVLALQSSKLLNNKNSSTPSLHVQEIKKIS